MARLQYTIDDKLKEKAELILMAQGLPPKVANTMFYIEIVKRRSLPFTPSKVPNEKTRKTFKDSDKGEGIIGGFDSPDKLFNSLEK